MLAAGWGILLEEAHFMYKMMKEKSNALRKSKIILVILGSIFTLTIIFFVYVKFKEVGAYIDLLSKRQEEQRISLAIDENLISNDKDKSLAFISNQRGRNEKDSDLLIALNGHFSELGKSISVGMIFNVILWLLIMYLLRRTINTPNLPQV